MHICIISSWEADIAKPHTFGMRDSKPEIARLLSDNIKRLRKDNKLTQEQLAERCGISTRHMSDIERSDAFPSPEVIEQIAKVLNIPSFILFLPSEKGRVEYIYSQRIEKMLESAISLALRNTIDKLECES